MLALLPTRPFADAIDGRRFPLLSHGAGDAASLGHGSARHNCAPLRRAAGIIVLASSLTACTMLQTTRYAVDAAISASQEHAVDLLVEAEIERRRLREARCISPALTPAVISAAAVDPRLGRPWLDELLRDCPSFAALVASLKGPADAAAAAAPPAEGTSLQSAADGPQAPVTTQPW